MLTLLTRPAPAPFPTPALGAPIVLSFDVEEHHLIEAYAGQSCPPPLQADYAQRMDRLTRWLLDVLAEQQTLATFFFVGQIARTHPDLVRAVHAAGHEVASHGWDHQRLHRFTPTTFRADIRQSCAALADVTGTAVVGYRAPTFSLTTSTAWAVAVLAEAGLAYDSSIFPVRHDRYGIPTAPRTPFVVTHAGSQLLELPPTTLRVAGLNLPVGGGGYFRLLPSWLLHWGLRQVRAGGTLAQSAMLYFHPWEFDADQPRLPLGRLSQWRTYVGTRTSGARLVRLLRHYRFARAVDVAYGLRTVALPTFALPSAH
jgi:polysaccharide deacetylase family protein (PEP-CTERM system associated)